MISTTLSSIAKNISNAYDTIANMGCSFPLSKNLENLSPAIGSLNTNLFKTYYYTGDIYSSGTAIAPAMQGVIEQGAFDGCINLSQAWFNICAENTQDPNGNTYFDLLSNASVYVPSNTQWIYSFCMFNTAFRGCHNLHDIVFYAPADNIRGLSCLTFASMQTSTSYGTSGAFLGLSAGTSSTMWTQTYFNSTATTTQRNNWVFNQSYSTDPMIWVPVTLSNYFTSQKLQVPTSCISYYANISDLPSHIIIPKIYQ